MARASLGSLLKIVDGDNSLIFKPGVAMIGNGGTTVMGSLQVGGILAPVVLDSAMPAITLVAGAGINWGVFGDLTEGYIWRMVRDVEVLVDPYSANDKRQIKYNAWARADGKQKNTAAYKALAGWTT
jgi:HK97 family phage major capsid protein